MLKSELPATKSIVAPTAREQIAALRQELNDVAENERANVVDRIVNLERTLDSVLRILEARVR